MNNSKYPLSDRIKSLLKGEHRGVTREALQGNAQAQYNIGIMFVQGHMGVPRNMTEGGIWLRRAASQNHVEAQFRFGELCVRDERDSVEEATKWLRLAAEQGHVEAQYELADVLEEYDEMGDQDPAEIFKWNRRAADQGHAVSQYSLGLMYGGGEGVTEGQQEAANWIHRAARTGPF